MKAIRVFTAALTFCFAPHLAFSSQEHDRFEGSCDSLQNAVSADLVQFLNAVVPDEKSSPCVTWAIHRLGQERYEPAIIPLVKLLDFRRPQTEGEKIFHGLSRETFPAEEALELIGKKALPELLHALGAETSTDTLRQNALTVWMEIYRQYDEQPKGVTDLKLEESKASDSSIKGRLEWAVQKAVTRCNKAELAECKQAARGSTP